MFRLIKFSVLSAAVLACCSSFAAGEEPADERLFDVPAVAPDAPVNFPTGLFAVEERGRFYNHNTFYCRGNYGNFCIHSYLFVRLRIVHYILRVRQIHPLTKPD